MGEDMGASRFKNDRDKEIAEAFKMQENAMSKKGMSYGAANGSRVNRYGEKKAVGYTDSGEGGSVKIQLVDVLGVRKMNFGATSLRLTEKEATRRTSGRGKRL